MNCMYYSYRNRPKPEKNLKAQNTSAVKDLCSRDIQPKTQPKARCKFLLRNLLFKAKFFLFSVWISMHCVSGQGQISPTVLPPERHSQNSELACFNVCVPYSLGRKFSFLGTLITLKVLGHFCS